MGSTTRVAGTAGRGRMWASYARLVSRSPTRTCEVGGQQQLLINSPCWWTMRLSCDSTRLLWSGPEVVGTACIKFLGQIFNIPACSAPKHALEDGSIKFQSIYLTTASPVHHVWEE